MSKPTHGFLLKSKQRLLRGLLISLRRIFQPRRLLFWWGTIVPSSTQPTDHTVTVTITSDKTEVIVIKKALNSIKDPKFLLKMPLFLFIF